MNFIQEISGKPILQVLGSNRIIGGNAERYRLHLSDGENSTDSVVLHTDLNSFVKLNKLCENTVIQIDEHVKTIAENIPIMVIRRLKVLLPDWVIDRRIGDPVDLCKLTGKVKPVPECDMPSQQTNVNIFVWYEFVCMSYNVSFMF